MPTTVESSLVSQSSISGNASAAMETPLMPLRTLIVDNYDSYTFNLLQLFNPLQLENVVVIRNDQFAWSVTASLTSNLLFFLLLKCDTAR